MFRALFLLAPLAAVAAPLKSPLAVTGDRIGSELQQTFISAPPDIAGKTENSFIAYRKSFSVGSAPKAATLHVFADVRYVLWLNGEPVHRGPNRFETRGPQYDSVAITSALRAGTNTLAIVVMGNASNARMMKHAPGLTLRIDADGRSVVKTDDTWKWSDQTRYQPAKVNWAHIIDRIDSRVEDGDWTQPAYPVEMAQADPEPEPAAMVYEAPPVRAAPVKYQSEPAPPPSYPSMGGDILSGIETAHASPPPEDAPEEAAPPPA